MHEINIAEMGVDPSIISQDPEVMSGTPVFPGTRVDVSSLYEYIAMGETLDGFLKQFPSVTKAQALKALRLAFERTIGPLDEDIA